MVATLGVKGEEAEGLKELKRNFKPEIEVEEVDANTDDPSFAQAVIQSFEEVMEMKKGRSKHEILEPIS